MNKDIMRTIGFEEEVKNFESNICPFCKAGIKTQEFRNSRSMKEYAISGLCQKCQDETFGMD